MEENLTDVMEPWRIALYVLWVTIAIPSVAIYAAARGVLTAPPVVPRVACGNCGYSMPAIEHHCPKCRAKVG